MNRLLQRSAASFPRQATYLWANLSRFTSLLIVLNISLFFLTGAVTMRGYYYTFISLGLLLAVELALLLPHGWFDRFGFYCACLAMELVALYFLVASVIYWVVTERM